MNYRNILTLICIALISTTMIASETGKELKYLVSEFHLVFTIDGIEKERVENDTDVPGQHYEEYQKQITPILKGSYDDKLKEAMAHHYGSTVDKIVIKRRFVHEFHVFKNNDHNQLYEREWLNGKISLKKIDFRKKGPVDYDELKYAFDFDVEYKNSKTGEIDMTYATFEKTFKSVAEAEQFVSDVLAGKHNSEVLSQAVKNINFFIEDASKKVEAGDIQILNIYEIGC